MITNKKKYSDFCFRKGIATLFPLFFISNSVNLIKWVINAILKKRLKLLKRK